jgi:hypothetical protein
MIYLDSSVALAYLLAEDRYPSEIRLSSQTGYWNAKSGTGSMRVGSKTPTAMPSAA